MKWLSKPISFGDFTLPFSFQELLLKFALPVVCFLIGALLIRILVRRINRRWVKDEDKQRLILRWAGRIVRILVFAGIVLSGISLLGAQAYKAMGNFFRVLNQPFFTSGNTKISVVTLLLVIPVFAVSSWAGKIVSATVASRTLKPFGLDAEKSFTIGRLLRYSAMALVFIIGLSVIGIDLSAIGVIFGVMGVGIGFGLQFLIADFFAGITLISMALIKEGDRINVGEFKGTIIHIRLMNTELTTFENETLIIPNSQLTGGIIHNNSYKDRRIVIKNDVDVSYNSNLDDVIVILKEVAARNPWLQANSEILVRVTAFADSGISMQLRTWIKDVEHRADARSWTNLEIWRSFVLNGIEIPFPQRVVHNKVQNDLLRVESSDSPEFVEGLPDTENLSEDD